MLLFFLTLQFYMYVIIIQETRQTSNEDVAKKMKACSVMVSIETYN
jgi:hypothetical protein